MKHELILNSPPVIRDFLTYSETIRGKSTKSVEEYYLDLQTFFRYIIKSRGMVPADTDFDKISIENVDIELIKTITVTDLYAFIVFCKNERGNGAAARARKTSTLRIFFKYLSSQVHLIDSNPAELLEAPKVKSALPRHLTLEDSLELLSCVDGPYRERDYCILTLFLNCGMRLSELRGINTDDIHGTTLTVIGKGNKERTIYLNDACLEAIDDWMNKRATLKIKPEAEKALFVSKRGTRLSDDMIQITIKRLLEEAGIDTRIYSVHKLRHTAATLMYKYGKVDIRNLQMILGHQSVSTTQIYTHVDDEALQKAIESNPLANFDPDKK